MPVKKKEDWEAWNHARYNFIKRDTEGFTKDLEVLEAHIKELQEVCPKDSAGWPVSNALRVLNSLRQDHARFSGYLRQLR